MKIHVVRFFIIRTIWRPKKIAIPITNIPRKVKNTIWYRCHYLLSIIYAIKAIIAWHISIKLKKRQSWKKGRFFYPIQFPNQMQWWSNVATHLPQSLQCLDLLSCKIWHFLQNYLFNRDNFFTTVYYCF